MVRGQESTLPMLCTICLRRCGFCRHDAPAPFLRARGEERAGGGGVGAAERCSAGSGPPGTGPRGSALHRLFLLTATPTAQSSAVERSITQQSTMHPAHKIDGAPKVDVH